MNNEVTVQTNSKSLMDAQKMYIESIGKGLESLIGKMDSYQAVCGYNILSAINIELKKNGLNHLSKGIDKESINDAIKFAVIYRLNTDNREVFVIVRNAKIKTADDKEIFIKRIECKPQYRGHLKILSAYGRDVVRVYPEWIVREGDEFTYTTYKGVEIIPPTWIPKSYDGKVLRVVVPIQYKDGYIDYRIAERESVATNIKAQIKQSVMYLKDKDRILTMIKDYTLDQLLSDEKIAEYVNETYTGLSSEEMIITKLVLNATKRVQINYESALARELMEKTYDNADVYTKSHTAEQIIANGQSMIEMQQPIEEEVTAKVEETPEVIEAVEEPKPELVKDSVSVNDKPTPVVGTKRDISDLFGGSDRARSILEDDDDRDF